MISRQNISALEKKIIEQIQGCIPVELNPYAKIAQKIGISEEVLLGKIKELMERGIIRRFGAVLHHRKAGFHANGMAVWAVSEEDLERVGRMMASFDEVTHCYERPTFAGWKYNLYTMIHGRSEEDCRKIVEKISDRTGIKEYEILFSNEEFKKESMRYF